MSTIVNFNLPVAEKTVTFGVSFKTADLKEKKEHFDPQKQIEFKGSVTQNQT